MIRMVVGAAAASERQYVMSQQPLDYQSPPVDARRWAWRSGWALRVGGLTLILLLVSLAYYSRTNTGWWSRGQFDIDVTHTALGLPHWLVINWWDARGTPPPLGQLPEGGVYQPGWHVHPSGLFVATFVCAGVAMLLLWATSRVAAPDAYRPYAVALILAAVAGAVVSTGPPWIGAALVLGVLPVVLVVASALGRSYSYASATGVAAMVLLWASHRLADVFRDEHFIHGPPDEDDLMGASLFIPAALIIVLTATFVARSLAARVRHNPPMQRTATASSGAVESNGRGRRGGR